MKYFATGVRHPQEMEDGKIKNVTEQLLVDALTFGEAEKVTATYATENYGTEYTIIKDAITNITDVIRAEKRDINVFWKAKVYFITIDEKSGREKKSACNMLVEAASLSDVPKCINEYLKTCVVDFEVGGIQDTKFIDVINHGQENKNIQN